MSGLVLAGNTSGSTTIQATDAVTATITLPSATDTLVGKTTPSFTTTIGVGNATPSASGAGITFPATQSASTDANTLDDYEEGTWTPSFGALSGSATYSGQSGTYTKIGRQVTVVFYLQINVSSSLVSDGNINGLPFAGSNTNYAGAALSAWNGGAFNGYYCMAGLTGASSAIQLRGGTTAAPGTGVAGTSITNGTLIAGSMTYFTA